MTEGNTGNFTNDELKFIADAARFFEDPGAFVKVLNVFGSGIEKAQKLLPAKAQKAALVLTLSCGSLPKRVKKVLYAFLMSLLISVE
jgi:hypothetical protein